METWYIKKQSDEAWTKIETTSYLSARNIATKMFSPDSVLNKWVDGKPSDEPAQFIDVLFIAYTIHDCGRLMYHSTKVNIKSAKWHEIIMSEPLSFMKVKED